MNKLAPVFFKGSSISIVYKRNLKSVIVYELKCYRNKNVYNKPITNNGLSNNLFPEALRHDASLTVNRTIYTPISAAVLVV